MIRSPGDDPGLIESFRRVAASLFATLQHRLELASIELGEAGERLAIALVVGIAALLLFGGTVVALSVWVAFALWPSLGQAVLGWIALVYALAGIGLLAWLRARMRTQPPLMAKTLAELRNDAELLRRDGDDR